MGNGTVVSTDASQLFVARLINIISLIIEEYESVSLNLERLCDVGAEV